MALCMHSCMPTTLSPSPSPPPLSHVQHMYASVHQCMPIAREIALIAIAIKPVGYTWLVCVQRSDMYGIWHRFSLYNLWIWYVQEVDYMNIFIGESASNTC